MQLYLKDVKEKMDIIMRWKMSAERTENDKRRKQK